MKKWDDPTVGVWDIIRAGLEWGTIALCLWTALYHTPLGALTRTVFGAKSRPLLSYYSGAVPTVAPAIVALPADVSSLAAGGYSGYKAADPRVQATVRSTLMSLGANIQKVDDPTTGPREIEKALNRLRNDGRSDSAALLTIFAGQDAASFAEKRAKGEGRGVSADDLGRQLPPGYENALSSTTESLAYAIAHSLAWPQRPDTRITSPFGWRTHPVTGDKKLHKGVDLGLPVGTPIWAAAAGTVTRSSYDEYNGNIVVVSHGNGVRTLYLHNSERKVHVGDRVEQGREIARSGATGIATGPHLHYQLEMFNEAVDPQGFRRNSR